MQEKKPISEATAAELREFARVFMGVAELTGHEGSKVMESKLQAWGWNQDYIFISKQNSAAPITPSGGASTRPRLGKDGKQIVDANGNPETETRIYIPVQEKPGGHDGVPLSINGMRMIIPRNEKVWVPTKYLEILNHAVGNEFAEFDGGMGGLSAPRQVHQFPYQIVPADEAA